jgi:hypothetical protein
VNELRLRAMIAALRGQPLSETTPNIVDLRGVKTPGRPFMPYVPGQDHTARFTEPQTYAQHAGLDPVPKALPYIDPAADWWAEHPEELDAYLDKLGYGTREN